MKRSIVVVVAATAVIVGSSLWLSSPGSARDAHEAARIAFVRGGRLFFVQSNGDGEHATRLRADAVWSNDGRWVVFATKSYSSTRGYLLRVYVARPDGSHRRLIGRGAADPCFDARWSPDDTQIAYTLGCDVDFTDLLVAGRAGKPLLLARGGRSKGSYWAVGPSWSPDGRTIVAAHARASDLMFHLALLDPSGRIRRTIHGSAFDLGPGPWQFRWSSDGRRIFFIDNANGRRVLDVIRRDGRGRKALSPDDLRVVAFDLSPDGARIAFTGGDGTTRRVYVMSASGANLRRLTDGIADLEPTWSPDGRLLAFTHLTRSPNDPRVFVTRISVMNADGSDQHEVSSGTSDVEPHWLPNT